MSSLTTDHRLKILELAIAATKHHAQVVPLARDMAAFVSGEDHNLVELTDGGEAAIAAFEQMEPQGRGGGVAQSDDPPQGPRLRFSADQPDDAEDRDQDQTEPGAGGVEPPVAAPVAAPADQAPAVNAGGSHAAGCSDPPAVRKPCGTVALMPSEKRIYEFIEHYAAQGLPAPKDREVSATFQRAGVGPELTGLRKKGWLQREYRYGARGREFRYVLKNGHVTGWRRAHGEDPGVEIRPPSLTPATNQDLTAEFLARGGQITRCPPAYVGEVKGAEPLSTGLTDRAEELHAANTFQAQAKRGSAKWNAAQKAKAAALAGAK